MKYGVVFFPLTLVDKITEQIHQANREWSRDVFCDLKEPHTIKGGRKVAEDELS